jgi:DNA polymerase-3 subunit alpha
MQYISLHTHSDASFLDSLNKPKDLARKTKELGSSALAVTDHGNVHNYIKLYKECKKQGIKFIPGLEFYFTEKHANKERKSRHITILAMNNKGLETIYQLSSLSNIPVDQGGGFFYRPRIDWEMIEKYHEGLICLTGCLNSPVNHQFGQNKDYEAGKDVAKRLLRIFGYDKLFVELQNVNEEDIEYIPEQTIILEYSRKLAVDLGLRTCATNDCHYINQEDSFAHEVLKAIDAKGTLATPIADPRIGKRGRLVYNGYDYYMRSAEDMSKKFTPTEIKTTQEIANMCDVNFPLKQNHMPKFDPNLNSMQVMEKLKEEARKGWAELELGSKSNKQEYIDRIHIELKDIAEAGLQDYLMIVWDVVKFCLNNNIPVNRGRGSAAGSLVCYLLRITDIDPIEFGLIWERFWNRGRKDSMPDIDIDTSIRRRDEVIKYLRGKFGEDQVYPMMTMSTMTTKQAIKDVGKVLGLSFAYVNELTDHVPHKCKSINQAIEENDVIKEASDGVDNDIKKWEKEIRRLRKISREYNKEKIRELENQVVERQKILKKTFENAKKLEDNARQRSAHACALLISNKPALGNIPLCYDAKNKKMLTAFDMYDLEDLGYLKLDILGLKTIDVCEEIYPGIVRGLKKFDDPKVYELIGDGKTKGIFQLETALGKQWCKRIKPQNILELAALTAILRPAVLEVGMADEYVKNRATEDITYIHEDLEPLLNSTYGCMIYQEEMLEIVKTFAKFDLSKADLLRKACGKKLPEEMKTYEEEFTNGCIKNNYDKALTKKLWEWINATAGYSFNKSHAVCYGILAYTTAWLKLYYPEKFFLAMLKYSDNEQKPQEEIKELFFDAKTFGIELKPPQMFRGNSAFELQGKNIYFGMKYIKSIGESSLKSIKNTKNGNWENLLIDSKKIGIKRDVLIALILSGALDYLGLKRYEMRTQFDFFHGENNEHGLTDREIQIIKHIVRRNPPSIIKRTKDKTFDIKLPQANNIVVAIKHLKHFLKNENIEAKIINSRRAKLLKDRCKNFLDNYDSNKEYSVVEKAAYEDFYLGVPVTCAKTDIYHHHEKTHDIIGIEREMNNIGICTIAIVNKITEKTDRNGKKMAFVGIEDKTFCMDAILFAKAYEGYRRLLDVGKVVLLYGVKRKDYFIINKIGSL